MLENVRTNYYGKAVRFGIRVCNNPFESVIEAAEAIRWTHDPFDRIIVAQATLEHAPLITKDIELRKYYKPCIW
jgi:PIN domain nuclease of toxin-antitoxin system